jgi:hypothetical protein
LYLLCFLFEPGFRILLGAGPNPRSIDTSNKGWLKSTSAERILVPAEERRDRYGPGDGEAYRSRAATDLVLDRKSRFGPGDKAADDIRSVREAQVV